MDTEVGPKTDAGLKPAVLAALDFLQRGAVPASWRMELKAETSCSEGEEDEDGDAEEQEEDGSSEEEEEEVEPHPEERENFLQQLYKFMEDRGTSINKRPVLGSQKPQPLQALQTGAQTWRIDSGSVWKQVYQDLGIPVLNSAAGYNVKCAYRKYLYGFEEYCTSSGICFLMDLPQKLGPKQGFKAESQAETEPRAPSPQTRAGLSPQAEEREPQDTQTHIYKEEKSTDPGGPGTSQSEQTAMPKKEEAEDEEEEEGKRGLKPSPGPWADAQPQAGRDDSSQEREGEEFESYPAGMKVQVRYGRGGSLKTYHATVKDSDLERGEVLYLVHYCGWNIRYDEWIKAEKIIRPANKNAQKVKHRKKIKNKAEREKDRLERLSLSSELPPPLHHRSHRSSRAGGPHDSFPGLGGPHTSPAKPREITSALNGLRASNSSSAEDSEREEDEEDGDNDEDERWGRAPGASGARAERGPRRRRAEGPGERTPRSKARGGLSGRAGDWLPAGAPSRPEDGGAGPREREEGGPGSSSSSCSGDEDEEGPRQRPRAKVTPSKRYNGLKEKTKAGRPSAFWEVPDRRPGASEERPAAGRPKGQKDVWSSIQAQWPKKTLKELFSDSDTEAANSPPPPPLPRRREGGSSAPEDPGADEAEAGPRGGRRSPRSPAGLRPRPRPPRWPRPARPAPAADASPPPPRRAAARRTAARWRWRAWGGGELQDLLPPEERGPRSPSMAFDGSFSSNSNCSLALSASSQHDSEQRGCKATTSLKRPRDTQVGSAGRKHKRSHKDGGTPPKKSRKTAHSSDSEDQATSESPAKSPPSKTNMAALKPAGRSPPSGHPKYHKPGDSEHHHHHHRDGHARSPRVYKWSFQMSDLEKMSSLERIAFLQEKLQDVRSHYLSLKSRWPPSTAGASGSRRRSEKV
ncbi:hypothetical protein AAFF_G00075820 [Aldrovandia affinis]|uniref:ARID domain-containing protein n=1 Tax=Aldrovandia affinis TaxID=143900 RepID=A0AAD7WCX8_9TELE|nr:hypothetical protein AAFF_G00075820 [Aldrovandia affinis]